jgi:hypothetical protein
MVFKSSEKIYLNRDVASNVTGDTFIASASTSPLTTLWMDERGPLRDRSYLVQVPVLTPDETRGSVFHLDPGRLVTSNLDV